jgi:hypothetical protein
MPVAVELLEEKVAELQEEVEELQEQVKFGESAMDDCMEVLDMVKMMANALEESGGNKNLVNDAHRLIQRIRMSDWYPDTRIPLSQIEAERLGIEVEPLQVPAMRNSSSIEGRWCVFYPSRQQWTHMRGRHIIEAR